MLEGGDLRVARVGEQAERLVGVGRDNDAVHAGDLPGDVPDLDAVLAPGDVSDGMGHAHVLQQSGQPLDIAAGSVDDAVPLRRSGDPKHAVMVEELKQVTGRVDQRGLPPGRPHAGDDRDGVVGDEMVAEPLPFQELAVSHELVVVGRAQEGRRPPVEPLHLPEQAEKLRVDEAAWLGEHAAQPTSAGILQPALLAVNAHAHLSGAHLDVQLTEQLAQPRVGHVVVDDEPAIDRVLAAIRVRDVVGVRMATKPVLRFEKDDVVGAGEQVSGGEPGDPGADHGHGRPPGILGGA